MANAVACEKPDYVIHLGDHADDAERLRRQFPMLPMVGVKGNCDYSDFDTPEQRLVEYGGVRVLMAHGHRFGVKSGLLRYYLYAVENQVDVALFGHTHCVYCEKKDSIWLMNPGSCGYGRSSYGVIEIQEGQINCSLRNGIKGEFVE